MSIFFAHKTAARSCNRCFSKWLVIVVEEFHCMHKSLFFISLHICHSSWDTANYKITNYNANYCLGAKMVLLVTNLLTGKDAVR